MGPRKRERGISQILHGQGRWIGLTWGMWHVSMCGGKGGDGNQIDYFSLNPSEHEKLFECGLPSSIKLNPIFPSEIRSPQNGEVESAR